MSDKDVIKKKIFELLDDCNKQLGKYKELRANGLSKDECFEIMMNARRQTFTDILDLIATK